MQVADGGRQNVHASGLNILLRLEWVRECPGWLSHLRVDFRTGPDVTDLPLYKDVRIEGFERFHCLPCRPYIALKWQGGSVKTNGVKSGPGGLQGLRE